VTPHPVKDEKPAPDAKLLTGTLLAFDFGMKRIGVAVGNSIAHTTQPLVTLHGHVHESARITGAWRESSGRTVMLGAAHDGPELALVRFDPSRPRKATRELIGVAPNSWQPHPSA